MSSFRDQLGEDWLRYQHHLDGFSPSTIANQPLPNGLNATTRPSTSPGRPPSPPPLEVPEVLPSPLLSSEPRLETSAEAEQDTESTLLWPGLSSRSTLEESTVDGPVASSPGPSPESQRSAGGGSTKEEEEEEDLGGRVEDVAYNTPLRN